MEALICGYCEGAAVWDMSAHAYVHATDGERVRTASPGDFVSARHNRAGTRVLAEDLVEVDA